MRATVVLLLAWMVTGCATTPRGPLAPRDAAPRSMPAPARVSALWEQMGKTMPGTWYARSQERTVTESFRPISNGSALVEDYTSSSGRPTASVYHPDGDSLLVTHYCAQGNQPRLRVMTISDDATAAVFRLVDATNLREGQAVLVEKRLRFHADGFDQTEIYRSPDGKTEETMLRFTRAK
ncbi:hypothetical protein LVJ94_48400 [Pendulispora rubella]|uniref:Lipoprotein n=1 Tax=Pendulispora rubella TaxID=2741070 RepID=A0ABZ2L191_9BACT